MRYLLIATMLALASESQASWGAGCSSSYGPVRVIRVVKKAQAKKTKSKKKAAKPAKKSGCPKGCDCECNETGCDCLVGPHCQCSDCPCGLVGATRREKPEINFGVIQQHLHKDTRHTINDKAATKAEVIRMLESADMPNDAGRLHFTIIDADKAVREQVIKDVAEHPAFAPLRDTLHVQAYEPSNWAVQTERTGFVPSIYLQAEGVPPLLRVEKYPGPEKMAQMVTEAVGRLRKRDPNYDPKKDPDGSKPIVAGLDPMLLWGGALVLLGALALKK